MPPYTEVQTQWMEMQHNMLHEMLLSMGNELHVLFFPHLVVS